MTMLLVCNTRWTWHIACYPHLPAGPIPQARGRASARARQNCRVRRSAATRVADSPAVIANEYAAPQADRDARFDRGREPRRPALGRDLERLVHRAAADFGPGLLVFGGRAGDGV